MADYCGVYYLSIILFLTIFNGVLSGVPVLLWEASSTSEKQDVPALYQLDSDEFSNHIVKKIHIHKPLIVIFLEETLSVEDFSWQDVQHQGSFPQIKNLTSMSAKVEFIPSVDSPVDALKGLQVSHNYIWKKYDRNNLPTKGGILLVVKMKDPLNNEDRPDLLRRHDKDIVEIYSLLLAKHSSIIAVYTGKQSSWVELESNRVRREAEETGNSSSSAPTSSFILRGNISNKNFLINTYDVPMIKIKNETINLTSPDCCKMDDRTNYTRLISSYKYNDGSKLMKLRFRFEKEEETRWKLAYVEFEGDGAKDELYPDVDISAPMGKSFKTTSPVTFKNKEEGDIELSFTGLQVQPFLLGTEFDEIVKAKTEFFTAGIWSGLIVSFILGMILTWGIVMLMDIKTMDRFDDPKGKTINTVATD